MLNQFKASIRILLIIGCIRILAVFVSIRIPTLGYLCVSGYKSWAICIYQDTRVGLLVLLSGFISQGLGGNCGILVAIFHASHKMATQKSNFARKSVKKI